MYRGKGRQAYILYISILDLDLDKLFICCDFKCLKNRELYMIYKFWDCKN